MNSQSDRSPAHTALVTDSPLMSFLKAVLCIATAAAIVITVIGIGRFGGKEFFQRMQNTVHSFSSEYYDIRTEEFDSSTISFGNVSRKTNSDVRNAPACLKMDKSKHQFLPGAFGTTTLYIIPNDAEKDMDIELEFNAYGARLTDNGEFKRLSDTESEADRLINGHILFFTERNGSYRGLLKDGKMTYSTAEHRSDLNDNGEYEVTVYWIWPEYYEQLVDTGADGAVITDRTESDEIKEYIKEHRSEFFYPGEEKSRSDDPSDQYDNADLLIHQNVEYIGFEIIALN